MKSAFNDWRKRASVFFGLKLWLTVLVSILVITPYFLIQNIQVFTITQMPVLSLDLLFPFNDQAIWVYQSLYFFTGFVTFQFLDRDNLIQYATGFTITAFISCLIFFLFPTSCPRPSPIGTNAIYQFFVSFEKPLNAFPSMHVSLSVYTALIAGNYSKITRGWKLFFWTWNLAIILSTLITKQHVFIDIIGGIILSLCTFMLVTNKFLISKLKWNLAA